MSQVTELFEKPLLDLLFEAQQVHRQHFDPRQVQVSTLLSIKTGACPEDCKYCPQSSRYKTGLETERLMEVEQVLDSARKAKQAGSTRFCMGAAWKNPHERDMPYLEQMVQGVKELGLEACMTLGTLDESQAQRLANVAGEPLLYEHIATLAQGPWNRNGQLGLVVGATYPQEIERVRTLAPTVPLLIPGVGAQGGDALATVRAGWRAQGPIVVNSSRAVLYASGGEDFAQAARHAAQQTRDTLNAALSGAVPG